MEYKQASSLNDPCKVSATRLLSLYREAFASRYGFSPALNTNKVEKLFRGLLIQGLTEIQLRVAVREYFKMNTEFYKERTHPVEALVKDINQILAKATDAKAAPAKLLQLDISDNPRAYTCSICGEGNANYTSPQTTEKGSFIHYKCHVNSKSGSTD